MRLHRDNPNTNTGSLSISLVRIIPPWVTCGGGWVVSGTSRTTHILRSNLEPSRDQERRSHGETFGLGGTDANRGKRGGARDDSAEPSPGATIYS